MNAPLPPGFLSLLQPGGEGQDATARNHPELLRALFELSPLGLQLIDMTRQRIVAVNEALVAITGYSREELHQDDGHLRFPPEAQPVRRQWFVDAISRGRFGPSEVDYLAKGGQRLSLVFNGVRVQDSAGDDYLWLSVQDMTAYRAVERELRNAASADRLTGLANRSRLMQALQAQAANTEGQPCAVLFLDFDRFKLVNDTLGHAAGDELLRAIARRLRQVADAAAAPSQATNLAAPRWLVSRFGGDEFVILLPQVAGQAQACAAADALLAALAPPYWIRRQEVHCGASIGIALSAPGGGDGGELLRDADTAMYEAKRAGRGCWRVFDDTMRARLTRAVRIESELRHAVAREQLALVYEPIVDLETGTLAACEAKLRWHHPELGDVAPAEFLPVAEEAQHILELATWMLRHACLNWAAWQQAAPQQAPALLCLNLARAQLGQGARLVESVHEALAAADMPPQALQLEITETLMAKHPQWAHEQMRALRELGVNLALDHFGTGASSLAGLRDLPVQMVKIDRASFAGLFRDQYMLAVAHATIGVIENLGMVSLAEGVADAGEVATLQGLGCRLGQGPLFGQALSAEELQARFSPG